MSAGSLEHKDFIRDHIVQVHRPIPGNPFGTKFNTSIHFASSISDERVTELIWLHLADLPINSFFWNCDPLIWQRIGRGYERRETKILATSKAIPFDEEVSEENYVKLPAPTPTFLGASRRFTKAPWISLIVPESPIQGNGYGIVYPSNLWSLNYPRLVVGEKLRIGREGWALQQERSIGYSLLRPQKVVRQS